MLVKVNPPLELITAVYPADLIYAPTIGAFDSSSTVPEIIVMTDSFTGGTDSVTLLLQLLNMTNEEIITAKNERIKLFLM